MSPNMRSLSRAEIVRDLEESLTRLTQTVNDITAKKSLLSNDRIKDLTRIVNNTNQSLVM